MVLLTLSLLLLLVLMLMLTFIARLMLVGRLLYTVCVLDACSFVFTRLAMIATSTAVLA